MTINDIQNKIASFSPHHPEIVKVILFGSFARGTDSRHSDIDLIIIMDTGLPLFERYKCIHREILDVLRPYSVEFFIYTPGEFDRMVASGNSFMRRVLKEGRVLYES